MTTIDNDSEDLNFTQEQEGKMFSSPVKTFLRFLREKITFESEDIAKLLILITLCCFAADNYSNIEGFLISVGLLEPVQYFVGR